MTDRPRPPRPTARALGFLVSVGACLALGSGAAGAAPDEPPVPWAWLETADPRPEASRFAPDLTEDERATALIEGRRSVASIAFETGDGVPQADRADAAGVVATADGVVATAWEAVARHALEPKGTFWVRVGDAPFSRAVPVGRTWLADVALLRPLAPSRGARAATWSASPGAAVGARCVAIGCARGRGNVAAAAVCSAIAWADPQAETGRVHSRAGASPRIPSRDARPAWLRFPETLATLGGEGSPVFDEKGRCVGIVATTSAVLDASPDRVMVRPAALFVPLVERMLREGGWRAVDAGFALGPPPRGDARFQGVESVPVDVRRAREAKQRGGALVARVPETGPANGVLWPGDVVLAIDGKAVFHETPETWIEPWLALRADTPCTLTLWRGGARTTLRVEPRDPAAGVDAQAVHDADGPRDPKKDPPRAPRGRR